MYLLGFRQYLKTPKSYQDLQQLIMDSQRQVTPQTKVVIAVCGDNPEPFLKSYSVDIQLTPYKDNQDLRQYVKQFTLTQPISIIYYGKQKRGLTFPTYFLAYLAQHLSYQLVAVSDSDYQMPYSAIKRAFEDAIQILQDKPMIYLPRRSYRSLDMEQYPINRFANEDVENAYFWYVTQQPIQLVDIQSGLVILNAAAIQSLDFVKTGLWTGNIDMCIQVVQQGGTLYDGIIVDTNVQNESTISADVQFKKIQELEAIYQVQLHDIIAFCLTNPTCFMDDWAKYLRHEEKINILTQIEHAYTQYTQR